MRKWFIALALLMTLAAGAQAQDMQMQVFVSRGALEEGTARQLVELLRGEFEQAQWSLEMEEEASLRDLVLADHAPQIAIGLPGEMLPWAKEGLLLPLTGAISAQKQIQEQVLACCVYEERLFMAPLAARHRRMAVNRDLLEKKRLGYLISEIEHPVWYVTQFHQIMEEFMLADEMAFEVWPAEPSSSAGIEALVQIIYGGALLADDGVSCQANEPEIRAGVKWLRDMIRSGMVGYAEDREAALERFIDGQTPIFIDWTEETAKMHAKRIESSGMELVTMPYPSSTGELVRAFELTGAAAFAGDDAAANDLAVRAIAFLHTDAQAQQILGNRAIRKDDALWLPSLSASDRGATLRALFVDVLRAVIEDDADADTALTMLQAAMDAAQ